MGTVATQTGTGDRGVVIMEPTDGGMSAALELLLWQVLWEPLGLPRHVRQHFAAEGAELQLAALHEDLMVGAAILVLTENVADLRHLAVHPNYQMQGVGRMLVEASCERLLGYQSVRTYARNSSRGFFERVSFRVVSEQPFFHSLFTPHGICFYEMVRPLQLK